MAYSFDFDLGKLPREFFKDIAEVSKKYQLHRRFGNTSRNIVKKFNVDRTLGVPLDDAVTIVEDLMDVYIDNILAIDKVKSCKQKVLLIPHCSRKFMDGRCKAEFDPKISSYFCKACSKDCFANKATQIAKERGYLVYILPGGSCIKKLMNGVEFEAVVGIACGEEIRLGKSFLQGKDIPVLGLPLTKNGCSNTEFNVENLKAILV
jgi:hypothetical protein